MVHHAHGDDYQDHEDQGQGCAEVVVYRYACEIAFDGISYELEGASAELAYIYDLKVNHVIIEAKKEVDYLFVLPHDGIEYIDIPLPETIARYRDFIDYGADGVIGTHPHCPQGWETYKDKPIFYSLGNFLFNSKENYEFRANRPHWYEGLCVLMTIKNNCFKWEVLNTRNVDNLRVVIDSDKDRIEHNRQLCRYLVDQEAYDNYLNKICATLGQKELSIIDRVFHPQTLKECTKLLFKNWKSRMMGKDFTNDDRLLKLLTQDARRNLLMQTLERNKSK